MVYHQWGSVTLIQGQFRTKSSRYQFTKWVWKRRFQNQRPTSWHLFSSLGRVTHMCVSKLSSIGADNGLAPARRQAIIWTNAVILLIGPPGTNFSKLLFEIHTFSFKKIHLKISSGKWRPFCLGLNILHWSVDGRVHVTMSIWKSHSNLWHFSQHIYLVIKTNINKHLNVYLDNFNVHW